ncbi:MAG: signal peptide peptidase SppA [Acidobacteria bacterium]|nr:signal peptide peptidase SppA [Acidobacteriota bacterium]
MRHSSRLTALVLLVASLMLVAAGMLLLLRPSPLPSRAVLMINLQDDLPEERGHGMVARFLGGREMTVLQVVRALDAAAADERIVAVNLHLGGVRCGLGRAQDVRRALLRVRAEGKPVVALLAGGGLLDTYLASAADEVYMLPAGSLMAAGIVVEVPFLRGVLDRVGVYPDFVTAGDGKDAPDPYTRTSMSEVMRRNMNRIVDDLQGQILSDMAAGRGMEPEAMQRLAHRGLLSARAAMEAGFVDGILHADEIAERIRELVAPGDPDDMEELSLTRYARHLGPGWLDRPATLALVYVTGVLVQGESLDNEWYGRAAGAVTLSAALKSIRDDEDIAAVVLRIDSPGGSAEAAEILWREISLTADSKPVVVSMGDYAASGGYYIAVAGDEILAEPSTITGSIGVFAGKFALQGFYDWIGMNWEQIKRTPNADIFHDRLPWTREQRQLLQEQVEGVHDRFKQVVVEGRDLSVEEVDNLATGRIFTGREAVDVGLVDGLGGLPQAIAAATRRAGLSGSEQVRLRVYPRAGGFLAGLVRDQSMSLGPSRGPLAGAMAEAALWDRLARERVVAYSPSRVVLP